MDPTATSPSEDELIEELVFECLEADDPDAAVREVTEKKPELGTRVVKIFERLRKEHLLGEGGSTGAQIPEQLGGFRLVRPLGAGGMGVVYLAEEQQLGREVALKLVRPEQLYFPGARERFKREVEAAARLQHPNIVPVYAVGEDQGLPFYSMEYVPGQTLSQVLQSMSVHEPEDLTGDHVAKALDLPQVSGAADGSGTVRQLFSWPWPRIALEFAIEIAEALRRAHERGVLHRDIKPSNVMITQDGTARLLDFGLARSEGSQDLTKSTTQLGSLPYLPPEQLVESTRIPSVRQDVYSLGVTLFEMLVLSPPFYGSSADETRRRILEARRPEIRDRNPGVSWELETVCLKAMDPDPTQRYPSIDAMLRDLENVRQHRSIEAKRPSLGLRTRRWAQRHPTLVAVSLVFALLSSIGAVAAWSFENARRRQADDLTRQAVAARAEAELRAEEATRVTDFLQNLFRYASPDQSLGEDVPVSFVLDQGVRRLDAELAEQPQVQSKLYSTFSHVYGWIGNLSEALRFAERAYGIERARPDPDARALVFRQKDYARALFQADRQMEGRREMGEALLAAEKLVGAQSHLAAHLRAITGQYEAFIGDREKGLAMVREAVAIHESLPLESMEAKGWQAETLGMLGILLHNQGHFQEAEQYIDRTMLALRQAYPPGHPKIFGLLRHRARNYSALGRHERAMIDSKVALQEIERIFGGLNPRVASALVDHAFVLGEAGRSSESLAVLEQAGEVLASCDDLSSSYAAWAWNDLGVARFEAGRPEAARAAYTMALDESRRAFPSGHRYQAIVLRNYADALLRLGEIRLAESYTRESIKMMERLNPRSDDHLRSIASLAWVLVVQNRDLEAERLVQAGLEIADGRPQVATATGMLWLRLALIENRRGLGEPAMTAADQALAHLDQGRVGPTPDKALAIYHMGWAAEIAGDRELAEEELLRSIDTFRECASGGDHVDIGWPLSHYGYLLLSGDEDRVAEAIPYLEEALRVRRASLPEGDYFTLVTAMHLGNAYRRQSEFANAEALLLEVEEGILAMAGPSAPGVIQVRKDLGALYEDWGKPDQARVYKR